MVNSAPFTGRASRGPTTTVPAAQPPCQYFVRTLRLAIILGVRIAACPGGCTRPIKPGSLYYQLAEAIEAAIRDGELAPGDRFENELALAKRLALS